MMCATASCLTPRHWRDQSPEPVLVADRCPWEHDSLVTSNGIRQLTAASAWQLSPQAYPQDRVGLRWGGSGPARSEPTRRMHLRSAGWASRPSRGSLPRPPLSRWAAEQIGGLAVLGLGGRADSPMDST